MLETMTGFAPAPAGFETNAGDQEAAGFLLTAQTQASIAALDLPALERRPAPDVLILDRDDLPPDARFAERLRTLDARVEQRRVPGYAGMMLDAHDAVVPAEMIRVVSTWLEQRAAAAPAATATPSPAILGRPRSSPPTWWRRPSFSTSREACSGS